MALQMKLDELEAAEVNIKVSFLVIVTMIFIISGWSGFVNCYNHLLKSAYSLYNKSLI